MTVTAPTSSLPSAPSTTTGDDALNKLSGNFSTFLTLLTTQLKNQDPTSPMDSNQFTQQLVQFSQVEQQINSNDNLKTLIAQGQSQGAVLATSYLGKKVTITDGTAPLTDKAASWDYTLKNSAAVTALSVTNANGQIVYSGLGETSAGAHTFAWNGKDSNGNQLSDGAYKLTITSKATDGSTVTSTVSSTGTVDEVDMTGTAPMLVIGPMSIGLSQVANVRN